MSSIDLIRMGMNNLLRRKTRTFLTILGVVIGTASIVVMLSLGFGMKSMFQKELSRMGSMNIITVYQSGGGMYGEPMGRQTMGKKAVLDDGAISKFKGIEGVQAVTPVIESYVKIVSGRYSAQLPVKGIESNIMQEFELKVSEGRLLSGNDKFGIVFGGNVPIMFRDQKSGINVDYGYSEKKQKPKVNVLSDKLMLTYDMSYGERRVMQNQAKNKKTTKLFNLKGIGILKDGQMEWDYAAIMDIKQLKKLIEENMKYEGSSNPQNTSQMKQQLKYQNAMVRVKDIKNVEDVQNKIKDMGFQASSLLDMAKSMQKTSSTIQLILGGIGAVSLLVAALGITNTMIMSIYERTREIGVMKVIGASLGDIKKLFLFESGMIGFMGGAFGLGISAIISMLLNIVGKNLSRNMGPEDTINKLSIIPLWLILASLAFSTMVGLISGYYPAKRAMKLSALEAIKSE